MTAPTAPTAFETGVATHPGKLREENEDSFFANPAGLWAVADGMGGHEAGQFASATVVAALGRITAPGSAADLLAQCRARIAEAHKAVAAHAAERKTQIGTTVAALLGYGADYACVWAGDSRIYRIREGAIVLLSRDHTEAQDLVDSGVLSPEEARNWPRRNVITRAVGIGDEPELDMQYGQFAPDDRFVLCSDGLTTHVKDDEIQRNVAARLPQQACEALVALALERGGTDNVTVLVVRCRAGYDRPDATVLA